MNGISGIDIPRVLPAPFERPEFDPEAHADECLKRKTRDEAEAYCAALTEESQLVADILRAYVRKNFEAFIETSRSIATMEHDTTRLRRTLHSFHASLAKAKGRTVRRNFDIKGTVHHQIENSSLYDGAEDKIFERLLTRREQILQWLDYALATHQVDKAIRFVARLEELVARAEAHTDQDTLRRTETPIKQLKSAITKRKATLWSLLQLDLHFPTTSMSRAQMLTEYLLRISPERSLEAARLFFSSRTNIMESALSSVIFSGDITLYISEYSLAFFHHVSKILAGFSAISEHSSLKHVLAAWLETRLMQYAEHFRRQVLAASSLGVISECLCIAFRSTHVLRKLGVDVEDALASALFPAAGAALGRCIREVRDIVAKSIATEGWRVRSVSVRDLQSNTTVRLFLTSSARLLYAVCGEALSDAEILPHPQLQQSAYFSVQSLVRWYLDTLTSHARGVLTTADHDEARLVAAADAWHVSHDMISRIRILGTSLLSRASTAEGGTAVGDSAHQTLVEDARQAAGATQRILLQCSAAHAVTNIAQWTRAFYSTSTPPHESDAAFPRSASVPIIQLGAYLQQVIQRFREWTGDGGVWWLGSELVSLTREALESAGPLELHTEYQRVCAAVDMSFLDAVVADLGLDGAGFTYIAGDVPDSGAQQAAVRASIEALRGVHADRQRRQQHSR